MSTSLKVVSIGRVLGGDETLGDALAQGVSFRRVWRSAARRGRRSEISGCGPAPRGRERRGAAGEAEAWERRASEACRPSVTRPAFARPRNVQRARSPSSAIRRTAGAGDRGGRDRRRSGLGPGRAPVRPGGLLLPGPRPRRPFRSSATTWPILTSAPAATLSVIVPAASAVPSEVILSVSSSKSGWSFFDGGRRLHVPFGEDAGADGFAHGRDFYVEGHV
jgi:hypothetical protein